MCVGDNGRVCDWANAVRQVCVCVCVRCSDDFVNVQKREQQQEERENRKRIRIGKQNGSQDHFAQIDYCDYITETV